MKLSIYLKSCYFFVKVVLLFYIVVANFVSAETLTKPFLYKLSKGQDTVYILGTLHFGYSTSDLPKWVLDLHDNLRFHAYEMVPKRPHSTIDFGNTNHFRVAQNMHLNPELAKNELTKMGADKSNLSKEVYDWVLSLGIPSWYANLIDEDSIMLLFAQDYFLNETYKSLDHEFILRSITTGKRPIELEDIELRNKAKTLATPAPKVSEFMEMGLTKLDLQNPFQNVFEDYKSGDLSLHVDHPEDPSVIYRNMKWLPKISKLAKTADAFITVGVGHLGGENGILKLMEKNGFTVERVSSSPQILQEKPRSKRYR